MRSADFIIADGILRHQERQAEAARWRGAAVQPAPGERRRVRIWDDFGRRVGARNREDSGMDRHGGWKRSDELFRVAATTGPLTGHYLACQATRAWAGEIASDRAAPADAVAPDRLPPRRIGGRVVAALRRAVTLLGDAPSGRATRIGAAIVGVALAARNGTRGGRQRHAAPPSARHQPPRRDRSPRRLPPAELPGSHNFVMALRATTGA